MRQLTLTVTQLNDYVRRSFASDPLLQNLCLTGELGNLKRHVSGHWYFTLKDEDAAINCAMFRQAAYGVRFRPENGQRVRLIGSVGLYTKTGSYQFYADSMEPDGIGDLFLRFEALKRKLAAEGLFDESRKKPLPLLPSGVGIVTSKTGAVVHDIARVAWRRYPGMPLYLCPVKVQGDGASEEIAKGIRLLERLPQVDVIIVGRGGGSMEDLWAFNEEVVARAIASCSKPIVSAVGHETDFTIADFAADMRAATPSAAAELAVPQRAALEEEIALQVDRLMHAAQQKLNVDRLRLSRLEQRLTAASPSQRQERMRSSLAALQLRMHGSVERALSQKKNRLEQAALRMRAAGPMETMKRGYAVITRGGSVMRSAGELQQGEKLSILMADGTVRASVDEVQLSETKG